jgi:hypothetical protein
LVALCPAVATAELWVPTATDINDAELEQRLAFIQNRLNKQQPSARYWQYGWTGFYSLSSAGQLVAALDANDKDGQLYWGIGAVKASGKLAKLLLKPSPATDSGDSFQALPASNREERLSKLAHGEALLETNAQRAGERFTWQRHAMGIAGNLVGGLVIAAFGDSSDALLSTLLGLAVGETTIWTEPAQASTDLQDYRKQRWTRQATHGSQWHVQATAGGAALHIRF